MATRIEMDHSGDLQADETVFFTRLVGGRDAAMGWPVNGRDQARLVFMLAENTGEARRFARAGLRREEGVGRS